MRLLTLKSVLVATDFGETSLPAIRTAARLAPLAGATLHLLHVTEDAGKNSETALREHYASAAPDGPRPDSVRAVFGPAAAVIVEYGIEIGADVIIVGAHRGGRVGGPLGSTARRVVRTALCPCLVAATELRLPLDRVFAPIDVSDAAGGALSVALSWTSALREPGGTGDLTVLHVTKSRDPGTESDAVRAEVAGARERAGSAAQVEIRERIVSGTDAAAAILREARSSSADLLVMGTRAAVGAPAELGSVSAAVVRETPCPLLLVPPAVWQRDVS